MRNRLLLLALAGQLASCGAAPLDDDGRSVEGVAGTGTGLTGRYYNGMAFETLVGQRLDPKVNFAWDVNSPMTGVNVDGFSVRWTGQIEAPVSGSYTFTTSTDDGVRLSIGGTRLIDDWNAHVVTENSGTVTLVAGQRYDLTLEYFDKQGRASAKLSWAFPGQTRVVVPTLRLYPTTSAPPPPAMNVYFGSTHMHTGHFNDHGTDESTPADILAAAKARHFDFLFVTEHSGHTGPASVPVDPTAFYADVKQQVANVTDGTFVGVAGYEYSDNDGGGGIGQGHMTAANTDSFLNADGTANAATLEDYLVQQAASGRVAYGGFNHPGAGGHPGSVASLLTAARRNVIVMTEVHNSYESSADADNFTGFIAELDRGWRVAPVCGLDGHGLFRINDTRGEPGPCRTGMLAPSLSRADLDAAFMARRLYSSRDVNLRVSYRANGQWMGSQIGRPTNVAFDITVSDPDTGNAADKIKKIEILTEGGVVVSAQTFDQHAVSWQVSVPANNRKYFLVRVFNGERSSYTAAAAPVWLE